LPVLLDVGHQGKKFIVAACRAIAFAARHLDAHNAGEALNSLNETHVLVFHQEADRCTVRPATETVVETLSGAHREGGCFFVMKWAAGLELAARFLELDALADDLHNVCTSDQIVNKILRY